jgi:hypothetical protein
MSGAGGAILAAMGLAGVINGSLPNGTSGGTTTWQLNSDGTFTVSGSGAGNWVTPANATLAAEYEVKVDPTTGTFATGTTGTWLRLNANRTWTLDAGSVTFTVSFRERVTLIVRSVQAGKTLIAGP